ncbi:MAG: hypothetical protein KUG79_02660 [Pseudomonadales bacterium]|nr:hypothetical protein [Pseudomonadales bacterium]
MVDTVQPFRLENGEPVIIGTECGACQHTWFPAVTLGCERCGTHGEGLNSRAFAMKGHLLSAADVLPGTEKGFSLATIELENGPAIRAILAESAPLKIGASVLGRIETVDDKSVVRFYVNAD